MQPDIFVQKSTFLNQSIDVVLKCLSDKLEVREESYDSFQIFSWLVLEKQCIDFRKDMLAKKVHDV